MWSCLKNSFITFNWSISGVLANYVSHAPLNSSRRDASFKNPYDYILNHSFLREKVEKLVETQRFCLRRLNHSFFHQGSYSQFLIWWTLRKLGFFGNNWKNVKNEKNLKMWYILSKNPKNCQNQGFFLGPVMGRHIFTTRWFRARVLHNLSEFCFSNFMSLSFMYYPQFKFFRRQR